MRRRFGLGRVRAWVSYALSAPARPDAWAVDPGTAPVAQLCGYASRGETVVVTDRGVEIPISRAEGWDVVTFTRLLAQIDRLPETPDRDEALA